MKIFCIGRNYINHAKELNNAVPESPVVFLKPDTALLNKEDTFFIPPFSSDIHYEVELVVKISKVGKFIEPQFAHKYYSEIGLGIDLTARDIQAECKKKGLPWELAKGFDGSAPLGNEFIRIDELNMDNIEFSLKKNDQIVQSGASKDMIFKIDELISYISQFYTLKMGDLIFTGTPEGVGPVAIGDHLEGFIGEKKLIDLKIA